MSPAESTIGLLVLVGLVALVMKWFTRDEKPEMPRAANQVEQMLADVQAGDDEDGAEIVAITSDGWAFVPDGDEVQLIPPGDEDDLPIRSPHATGYSSQTDPDIQVMAGRGGPINPRTHKPVSNWKPGDHIDQGDYVAVRVKRGAPDFDPWRLEALGRDHEYRAWFFETEDAARAACDLLQRRIVIPPRDEHGDPRPVEGHEFDDARSRDEDTERALDSGEEDER